MSYTLNGTDLSTYGIVAGHAPGSNISITGHCDLPSRIEKTFHSWAEEDGLQPYVTANEIFFSGRKIKLYGAIFGTTASVGVNLINLGNLIEAFTDLVTLSTPYGDYSVYVESVIPTFVNNAASLIITFNEPVVDLSGGTLPAAISGTNKIDAIPFLSFGLYLEKDYNLADIQKPKAQHFTKYGSEGYQITKRESNTLKLKTLLIATSLADFQAKIKNLYLLFSSSGERTVTVRNMAADCFAIKGFNVNNIIANSAGYVAKFNIELLVTQTYLKVYLTEDAGTLILTTEDNKIIIYG